MRRPRGARLAAAVVLGCWLGLMAYLWFWSEPEWGVGWALFGTLTFTILALLVLLAIWLRPRR